MLNPTPATAVQVVNPGTAAALQAGRTYAGVVRAQPEGLFALIGTVQVPLDPSAGLDAGQRIRVQVSQQGDSLQLSIRPQVTTGASPIPDASALLAPILQSLGRQELIQFASTLLPRQTPPNEESVRALVTLLLGERGAARDVGQLQQILARAVSGGILSPDAGASLSPWLALTALADPAAWHEMVRRARSERNAATRLAALLQGDGLSTDMGALKSTLATLMKKLLSDQVFQTWLRQNGQADEFRTLAERVFERASGSDVQNLRNLDQFYQFLELPVPESQGFNRLQLHFFSDGKGSEEQAASQEHRTVLDLEMSHLGPLWIDLRALGQRCVCHFQMATQGLCDHVTDTAVELTSALTDLGFAEVKITASVWGGDREKELLALLSPFKTLNLEV
jgi:hypothetical protein